jgi:CRISPR-associated protein Cas2
MRLNEYRIMWILVFYDLPTETIQERKAHAEFRRDIMRYGFTMFQFSIYMRHCSSRENAEVHVKRVKNLLPEKGKVGILTITDKQFGMMELFYGVKRAAGPESYGQLSMF